MSKIEEMIAKLCPNGVEYKTLGEIAIDVYRGSGITRDQITESGFPCVRYGEIYTTYGIHFDKCISHTNLCDITSPKYFEYGDILFAITGENIDDIAKSTAYVGKDKCLAGGDIVVLKHKQNPKYLAYVLSTTDAIKQKGKGKVKSKVVHSSVPAIREIKIPIPPLEIQEEIVHILDKFTELTAELTARKKQYEFYRDQLLSFGKVSPPLTLSYFFIKDVISSLKTGLNPRQNFKLNEEGSSLPYITGKDIYGNKINISTKTDLISKTTVELINKRACIENDDLLFASTGTGTVGRMAIVTNYDKDWAISETLYSLKPKKEFILTKYLLFILNSNDSKSQYEPKISKGSVPHLKVADLLNVKIPVPSLAEQERIVGILDRFDTLVNDISQGIPAEIEVRKKQYEYYRDRLLTFEKVG